MNKRQQNTIIITFLFFSFVFLAIIYISIVVVYPQLVEISTKKEETRNLSLEIDEISKKGISYNDYIKLNKNLDDKTYLNELIKNIDEDFYNEYLINNGDNTYANFIKYKKEYFNEDESKELFLEKDSKVASVLPYFSENYSGDNEEQSLSNFKFVSYIERLLETFNLQHNNSLGIFEVSILDDYISENTKEKSIETNIFSIPVKLNLNGTKEGIINFLHYIENVGKIYIEDDEIYIYNDSFLMKNGVPIKLEGDKLTKDYNIYKHQIIDVKNIKISEYLDSSSNYRTTQSFVDFIKETGGNELTDIEIDLLFYVKGYPQYKLEQLINDILNTYTNLQGKVNKKLESINENAFEYIEYKKINNYMVEIQEDINMIRKELTKGTNLENVYTKALKYKYIFNNIDKLF